MIPTTSWTLAKKLQNQDLRPPYGNTRHYREKLAVSGDAMLEKDPRDRHFPESLQKLSLNDIAEIFKVFEEPILAAQAARAHVRKSPRLAKNVDALEQEIIHALGIHHDGLNSPIFDKRGKPHPLPPRRDTHHTRLLPLERVIRARAHLDEIHQAKLPDFQGTYTYLPSWLTVQIKADNCCINPGPAGILTRDNHVVSSSARGLVLRPIKHKKYLYDSHQGLKPRGSRPVPEHRYKKSLKIWNQLRRALHKPLPRWIREPALTPMAVWSTKAHNQYRRINHIHNYPISLELRQPRHALTSYTDTNQLWLDIDNNQVPTAEHQHPKLTRKINQHSREMLESGKVLPLPIRNLHHALLKEKASNPQDMLVQWTAHQHGDFITNAEPQKLAETFQTYTRALIPDQTTLLKNVFDVHRLHAATATTNLSYPLILAISRRPPVRKTKITYQQILDALIPLIEQTTTPFIEQIDQDLCKALTWDDYHHLGLAGFASYVAQTCKAHELFTGMSVLHAHLRAQLLALVTPLSRNDPIITIRDLEQMIEIVDSPDIHRAKAKAMLEGPGNQKLPTPPGLTKTELPKGVSWISTTAEIQQAGIDFKNCLSEPNAFLIEAMQGKLWLFRIGNRAIFHIFINNNMYLLDDAQRSNQEKAHARDVTLAQETVKRLNENPLTEDLVPVIKIQPKDVDKQQALIMLDVYKALPESILRALGPNGGIIQAIQAARKQLHPETAQALRVLRKNGVRLP